MFWSLLLNVILGLEEKFQGMFFGHAFSKCANMPQMMTKFVRTWNMCLLNLPKKICKNHYLTKEI